MTRMRRPWFELGDDRVVVVRLIVGLEPDLSEVFMDDDGREKRNRETTCKLVMMVKERNCYYWSTYGVVLYEESMNGFEWKWSWIPANIIGLIPGSEQKEIMEIEVAVDWIGRVHGSHSSQKLTDFTESFFILSSVAYCVCEMLKLHKHRWIYLTNLACFFVGLGGMFLINTLWFRNKRVARRQFEKVYPCFKKKIWNLMVSPCDHIVPILWNETMWPAHFINFYSKVSFARLHHKFEWKRSPPCDHPSMPRLLCTLLPSESRMSWQKTIQTPSGVVLKNNAELLNMFPYMRSSGDPTSCYVLPDINVYNNAVWRKRRMMEFPSSDLKKELMEIVWHPRRVERGFIEIDE